MGFAVGANYVEKSFDDVAKTQVRIILSISNCCCCCDCLMGAGGVNDIQSEKSLQESGGRKLLDGRRHQIHRPGESRCHERVRRLSRLGQEQNSAGGLLPRSKR